MNTAEIAEIMRGPIEERKCFLVDVSVSKDNDIEITIESEEGTVTLDDCIELSRFFESRFDREKEDYSLTVTSAGLDQPFKVPEQYRKAMGKDVEIAIKGGKKITALLTGADAGSITVKYSAKESVDGKKKKVMVEHTETLDLANVNSVKYHIVFE